MDILIKNAKLRDREKSADIAISGGKISKIANKIEEKADKIIDADNNLVSSTFIDPHNHLDKALISEVVRENKSGTLMEAIEIIWDKKNNYTIEDNMARAEKCIKWYILKGTTIIRTHVDVDTIVGLKAVESLIEVRKKFGDLIDLQIVAFPQEGIYKDPGTEKLMREAMKLGADVVGGMPFNEYIYDDSKKHIDFCYNLAKEFDADIDMHVDESDDVTAHTLEYLAAMAIKNKYFGRVTAGHTCSLAAQNPYKAAKVISMVKEADMNMITNPATNLMLEGRLDQQPVRRGITRVKELMEAGVNVAYGQDCLKDTFYPTFGQADMLEVGMIAAHAAMLSMPGEIEDLFDMPTTNSAKILKIDDYGIKEGNTANLNIIKAPSVQEAFRTQPDRTVVRKGKVIAETHTEEKLYF